MDGPDSLNHLKPFVLLAITFVSVLLSTVFCWCFPSLELAAFNHKTIATLSSEDYNKEIKLIEIDNSTLKDFNDNFLLDWPFPRSIYVKVIKYLERAGAKALAIDLKISEGNADMPDDDNLLADAVRTASMPIVIATHFSKVSKAAARKDPTSKIAPTHSLENNSLSVGKLPSYNRIRPPLAVLRRAGIGLGSVIVAADPDGIYRRYPPGVLYNNKLFWSLPFALALATGELNSENLAALQGEDNQFILHFRGIETPVSGIVTPYERISMGKIVRDQLAYEEGKKDSSYYDIEKFRDTYVILGWNAHGHLDRRSTPINRNGRGLEIHAVALDNLLRADFHTELSMLAGTLVNLSWAVLATALSLSLSSLLLLTVTLFVLLGLLYGSVLAALAIGGLSIPLIAPALAIIISFSASTAWRSVTERARRRLIKECFQHYLSKDVIEDIIKSGSTPQLAGESKELTIFFSDIEGFTSISERLAPEALVRLLNRYLGEITKVILQYEGTFDKYIGDAIVAFWNAPVKVESHAVKAVQATCEALQSIEAQQDYFEQEYGVRLNTRVGLATGEVVVGNFGAEGSRVNYSIMGDYANLAARLESANKQFGTQVLVSSEVYRQSKRSVKYRRIGHLKVVGREASECVYEPLECSVYRTEPEELALFHQAQEQFEKGDFTAAKVIFSKIRLPDPVVAKYLKRIATEQVDSSWTSSWNLLEK